jgi:carbon storage regulator
MLVLTRKIGEEIVIAGNIHFTILEVHGDRVRLGVKAPESVRVDRAEVHNKRHLVPAFVDAGAIPSGEPFATFAFR